MARAFDVHPIDATFGAVITGVKLASIDDATLRMLHEAWLQYALLVFPAQSLSRAEQIAFAKRFGPLELELSVLSNIKPDGTLRIESSDDDAVKIMKGNMIWHADSTYMPVQAKGAVFSAEIVPSAGGETEWADMRAAYEALDATTRSKVDALSAYHSLHYSQSKLGHVKREGSEYHGYGLHDGPAPLRPLVKAHPETGRKSLNIGRHAYGIPGMEFEESERFLDKLAADACRPPRVYAHRWTSGDTVIWDNRCLMHRAMPWNMAEPRRMVHSRIAGDPASESAPVA
ncbi:MAG: TauD/TfdA family dioxygenase [Alphaproteobacteria bacterium]|nr:TauD/TfdA family dioxygenase [Alphaproteobacteria bacterium]